MIIKFDLKIDLIISKLHDINFIFLETSSIVTFPNFLDVSTMIDIILWRCRIGCFTQKWRKSSESSMMSSEMSTGYFLFFIVS